MTEHTATSTTRKPRRRFAQTMLIVTGATAIGLFALPALTASASPAHPGPAAETGTPQQPAQQPPLVPYKHTGAFSVTGTTAGMPPTAQSFYAVVGNTGGLARGFQATGAHQLATGTYQVDFSQNITGCAYLGTIGLTGSLGASAPGEITVVGRAGDANGVFVQTFNSAGTLTNLSFHLGILC
jgi:hypothetical protein